jgi:hypothetical protein
MLINIFTVVIKSNLIPNAGDNGFAQAFFGVPGSKMQNQTRTYSNGTQYWTMVEIKEYESNPAAMSFAGILGVLQVRIMDSGDL